MKTSTALGSLLPTLLLLGACAPAATGKPDAAPQVQSGLRGPLKTGETWTISGLDQNNNAISGKVKLTGQPLYRASTRTWFYEADNGYALYYDQNGDGATFSIWNDANPKRLMACYLFAPFTDGQRSYDGAGLAGTDSEIDAVFAKLQGSGTALVGGTCKVTRN